MTPHNPFVISGYSSPYYFCDREEECQKVRLNIRNGRNTAIISTRRMGKTGLINHCFQDREIGDHYYTFFIDIYATGSLREFVFEFGKGIFETLKPKGRKFIDRFFEIISSFRVGFRLSSDSGEPSFEMGLGEIRQAQTTLEEVFRYLEMADKPCIVAIDEFQQIQHYPEKNMEAILRTLIQQCKNTLFIFSGSQQHMMSGMFLSPSRPFYQSVTMMHLDRIPLEKYKDFVLKHFKDHQKRVAEELIDNVYRDFEGHTWYLQMMFNELFTITPTGQRCTRQEYDIALTNHLSALEFTFQEILSRLPEKQKEVLIAIAREGKASAVTSGEFIQRYSLTSSSSVQSALKYLIEKDLVTKNQNEYTVYDRFFGIWLKRKF